MSSKVMGASLVGVTCTSEEAKKAIAEKLGAHREKLPETRRGTTRKFKIPRGEKASRADERSRIVTWLRQQGPEAAALAERIAAKEHGTVPADPLKMWVTINTYKDGRPGEIFIKADKTGTLTSGALDAVAVALSMAWQHGVSFEATMGKLHGMKFEPSGLTGDARYPMVASPLDYIARWALDKFGKKEA